MPIQKRSLASTPITTSLGTLLTRTATRLGLPRGTRLGVVVGHRQIRSDKRFLRARLPKHHLAVGSTTVKQAAEDLILPRLPAGMKGARVVAYAPGERTPAGANTLLRTARAWGDGLTEEEGELFDQEVEVTYERIQPIYNEIESFSEEEVVLAAVCRLFSTADQMRAVIDRHRF